MDHNVKVALAQIELVVGDIAGNTEKIITYSIQARDELFADLVIFPELSICGYPPEDLLFHDSLRYLVENAMVKIRESVHGIAILIGFPEYNQDNIYNACEIICDGKTLARYRKQSLPNYSVFDEERYFTSGNEASVFKLNGIRIGLNICEDVWSVSPIEKARSAGAECIIVINGSPFEKGSQVIREQQVEKRVINSQLPIIYVNMVGGQDELVFDGGSFAMSADRKMAFRAPAFEEGLYTIVLQATTSGIALKADVFVDLMNIDASVYKALVIGTRDYITKHGFPGIILGLSGGIDSALVATIACDAIGPDRVHAVMMPFRYTSNMSQEDASLQATTLGIRYDVISIESMYEATIAQLSSVFDECGHDVTEENIQSRCRGLLLMAISNKTGHMLLTTGNKSEMAVGYATLYGDMAGGFSPIKDCTKTLVYRLAKYRNSLSAVIPKRVIEREPSAELRPDQKDSDSLPDYTILDPVLEAFIEEDLSVTEITKRGFDQDTVVRILEMVKSNEFKRRQAPPGVRISSRAFGRDWRYPITSGYKFPY
ncbi:MAG: NAD+ synthase [Woeseiaceae bacterium]|jgi:NAD+ synthase (glutamine-hydrolysing)|nr:NAD+ synthase [Woeseiaceae bacterium]